MNFVNHREEEVKQELKHHLSSVVDRIIERACNGATAHDLETGVWEESLILGNAILTAALTVAARKISERDIEQRGLSKEQVVRRLDRDYCGTVTTTFGKVKIQWSAYREKKSNGDRTTHNPAKKELFPAFDSCRSSKLCLEWECRLGSDETFRAAQESLNFFTHGAVSLEDNTISRHLCRIGQLVARQDMYMSPEEIKAVLRERATRDRKTGRPLLYISSDAHALRRYVDDTFATEWKMANGIRLWCEDKDTGQIIHLGGEFTWGDCHEVTTIFEDLIRRGILTTNGRYSDDVHAQNVWLSDGAPWFSNRIHPLFEDLLVILDAYHLLEAFSTFFAFCFGAKTKEARSWYDKIATIVAGEKPSSKGRQNKQQKRRGHRKRRNKEQVHHAHQNIDSLETTPVEDVAKLGAVLFQAVPPEEKMTDANKKRQTLFDRIKESPGRFAYPHFRRRGIQIGSGAMESLHRTGSQMRLKLPGAKWLPETSRAIFNVRMMRLTGKWDQFWAKTDLESRYVQLAEESYQSTNEAA